MSDDDSHGAWAHQAELDRQREEEELAASIRQQDYIDGFRNAETRRGYSDFVAQHSGRSVLDRYYTDLPRADMGRVNKKEKA